MRETYSVRMKLTQHLANDNVHCLSIYTTKHSLHLFINSLTVMATFHIRKLMLTGGNLPINVWKPKDCGFPRQSDVMLDIRICARKTNFHHDNV